MQGSLIFCPKRLKAYPNLLDLRLTRKVPKTPKPVLTLSFYHFLENNSPPPS